MNSTIVEFDGDKQLRKVKIKNLTNDQMTEMKIAGVFIFIGYKPNTE